MAIDVLLSTDEITVLGPPNNIELSVNIGPAGTRGSQIYAGLGNPNDSGVLPNDIAPQVYDLFINASTSSRYSWVYQYIVKPAGLTWEPILQMAPAIYSENLSLSFNGSGIANESVLLSDITGADVITDANRYVVTISPIGADPIAWVLNSKTITVSATSTIDLVIEAVKYSGSWSALTGVVTWGVTIAVV